MLKEKKNLQKELEETLEFLKKIGHSRREIERKLNIAVNGLDQSKATGTSKKMLASVLLYKEWAILNKSISGPQLVKDADTSIEELSDWLQQLQSAAAATQKQIFDKLSSGGTVESFRPSS